MNIDPNNPRLMKAASYPVPDFKGPDMVPDNPYGMRYPGWSDEGKF